VLRSRTHLCAPGKLILISVRAIGLTSCFFIHRDAPPASLLRLRRKDLETLLGDGLEKVRFFLFSTFVLFEFLFFRVSHGRLD
jgi:hypothetical protein